MKLPKIVLVDYSSLITMNEHERDLSILEIKASRCVLIIPPILKSEREFVRKGMNWK